MKYFPKSSCCFLIFALLFTSLATSNSANSLATDDAHGWSNLKCFVDEGPTTLKVNEGEPFELPCHVLDACYSNSGISWIKQFYDGGIKTINDSRITLDPDGTLRFSNVTKLDASDEYNYACAVLLPSKNEYKIGNRVILDVVSKCFKDYQPETVRVNEGEPFKLSCQPLDDKDCPHSGVYWLIQDINGGIKSIDNSRLTVDPEGNLWFSSVDKSVASKDFYYACAVLSPSMNEYKIGNRVILDVVSSNNTVDRIKPVKQYVSGRNETALLGKKIELFCIYGGMPLPITAWSKDGERIQLSDRIVERNYGKSLVIKQVESEDEGVYRCDVANSVDTVLSNTVNLKVQS